MSDVEDTLTVEPAATAVPPERSAESASEATIERAQVVLPRTKAADEPVFEDTPLSPQQYFAFRIGHSAVVHLDAIAYVGRKPSIPRVVRGGLARLVRVSSPTNEVSSTHIELRQAGSTVVVHDLNSTNGTTVAVPGFPVRALRPGESLVVTVGTLIDIGDRNVIEILPKQEKS